MQDYVLDRRCAPVSYDFDRMNASSMKVKSEDRMSYLYCICRVLSLLIDDCTTRIPIQIKSSALHYEMSSTEQSYKENKNVQDDIESQDLNSGLSILHDPKEGSFTKDLLDHY